MMKTADFGSLFSSKNRVMKIDDFTKQMMQEFNLADNFIVVSDYKAKGKEMFEAIPGEKGIYFVITEDGEPNDFLEIGTGGFYRENNPNVAKEILRENWVKDAAILYIGRGGGTGSNGIIYHTSLKKRIKKLILFGHGMPIGHWGGRFLWQHEQSGNFKVYWHSMPHQNPVTLERELLQRFKQAYGKAPFANLILYNKTADE